MDYIPISNKSDEKGFSLVELAIVLVIMGLLVAGAVAGKEILQISKLRGVISEVQKYKVAIESFQQTYEGLPGDIKNATSYWGAAADCVAPYTSELGKTCNGNGDGWVGSDDVEDNTEPYTAWTQLSLAKIIAGNYSGAGTEAVVGVNSPKSTSFDGGGYSFSYHAAPWSYEDSLSRRFPANYLMYGKSHATRNDVLTVAVSPADALYIDSKMDDGTPDFGDVLSGTGDGATGVCVTGSAPNIIYSTSNNDVACTSMFAVK